MIMRVVQQHKANINYSVSKRKRPP